MNTASLTEQERQTITGLVLAGGMGRRMNHQDKGLVPFRGRPMAVHVIERLAPQVGQLIINANQNLARYAAFGYSVLPDTLGHFAGPLAGLHAALTTVRTPWIATAPCDSPLLPADLVARLYNAALENNADVAVASSGGHVQPVFALIRRTTLPRLMTFFDAGDRKIDLWFSQLSTVEVSFDDQPDAFRNINTLEDLSAMQHA